MATPQRESYQLPSAASGAGQTTSYGQFGGSGLGTGAVDLAGSAGPQVSYICGECASKVSLTRSDAIRCKECGHRVLYKERTKRMVQFEAR